MSPMKRAHRRGQRYEPGQIVYVRGWPPTCDATVLEALVDHQGWPCYEVMASTDQSVWIVPRIHCSTRILMEQPA